MFIGSATAAITTNAHGNHLPNQQLQTTTVKFERFQLKTDMIKMKKATKKIYRKYQDFYSSRDLRDPDTPTPLNLTIDDFDARGRIVNPRAPCVVTTIDPDYIKDARQQRLAPKFRMKTDILRLREITRKKFTIYRTQEMQLDKQREYEHNEQIYQRQLEFYKFCEESLQQMETQAFKEMLQSNAKLKRLQEVKVAEQLKEVVAEHQRVLMEVQDVYRRFLFQLKLVSYFDIVEEEGDGNGERLTLPKLSELGESSSSDKQLVGGVETARLQEYMETVVRPYLAKQRNLNAEVWLLAYEQMRHKIFNYNRRLTGLALLNHIVSIIWEKFQKTYARRMTAAATMCRDPGATKQRVEMLKMRAVQIMTNFERQQKQDKLSMRLKAIVPIILASIEQTVAVGGGLNGDEKCDTQADKSLTAMEKSDAGGYGDDEQDTTMSKVEKIQSHLFTLLNALDAMPPDMVKAAERRVQSRMRMAKDSSRRALVKQTRLHNWMQHFRKHALQKDN